MVAAFSLVQSRKLCNFDLNTKVSTCLFNVSMDIHKQPTYSCGCSNPDCTCEKKTFKKLANLRKVTVESNGWNPGGQGEGFGEPIRSSMGGEYRYSIGRENTDQQDPKSWQKYMSQDQQGQGDWHKYMSQDQQGRGDWHKYMNQDQGEKPSQGQSQDLLFNFTVTGKNIQIESSFGLGGGGGDLEISRGSGGGGGGQHKILIEKGTVRFLGGFNGKLYVA